MQRNKLGIIVPYRNRYEHFAQFHDHINMYLSKKGIDYKLIIVEQDNASSFNRGMLCNIGFKEAIKQKCNYVVFHDVDMLPIEVDYSYSAHPIHLATDELPFDGYFGGITLFPTETFQKINGFSNRYWGWGFEDDDLRYRCIKNGVKLEEVVEKVEHNSNKTAIFNGTDAYIKLSNNLNVLRDFKLKFNISLDKLVLDHTKQIDDFVIFNIKGNDFTLKYTSFKRFSLQVFDKKNKLYEIYSKVMEFKNYLIEVEYKVREKQIALYINKEKVGSKVLDVNLFNYNRVNDIYLGTRHNLTDYFKGALHNFEIKNNFNESVNKYRSRNIKNYKLVDEVSGNDGKLVNIQVSQLNNYSYISHYRPYRRTSIIKKLNHEQNGFLNGRWKSDLTRWNQLRFTNEVVGDDHDESTDGLTTCKFKLHGKKKNNNTIHLNVGI